MILALAKMLLLYRRDVPRARELLKRLDGCALSDTLQFAVWHVKGLLALETGDDLTALNHLRQAMRETRSMRNLPNIIQVTALIQAHMAIAQSHLGDGPAARRLFRQAEPYLRARRADIVLERCTAALSIDSRRQK